MFYLIVTVPRILRFTIVSLIGNNLRNCERLAQIITIVLLEIPLYSPSTCQVTGVRGQRTGYFASHIMKLRKS